MQASASLNTGALQGQFDGTAALKPLSFKGKMSASSQSPGQFLPSPLLALLGGEANAALRVSAAVSGDASHIDARELSAESPGNLVSGHLSLGTGSVTHVDAELSAGKVSLPAVMGYFLSQMPGNSITEALPASLTAAPPPADIWSGRPFALSTFRETEGVLSLNAKSLKLTDTLSISGAALHASLAKGQLTMESLSGKVLGGSLDANLGLTAKDNGVTVAGGIGIAGADLSGLAAPGTAPLIAAQGASLSLKFTGQGLSPRGLISVLHGRGAIRLPGGQLSRLTPHTLQGRADELLGQTLPLTEDAISKSALEAIQARDFKFRKLAIPVIVADGTLDMPRASFRDGETTVRMQAYIDLNKAIVDSTWQMGVSSDRKLKWPPVKVTLAGPLREIGARPRTLAAEDFVRALLVHKMEGDINRLENMGKPGGGASAAKPPVAASVSGNPSWAPAAPQPTAPKKPKKKKEDAASVSATAPIEAAPSGSYEQRMRDAIDRAGHAPAQ